jgi:hypothetical protein
VTSVSSAPLADDRFVISEGWSPLFFAVFAAFAFFF